MTPYHQPTMIFAEDVSPITHLGRGSWSLQDSKELYTEEVSVTERSEYSEDLIVEKSTLDGAQSMGSFIEITEHDSDEGSMDDYDLWKQEKSLDPDVPSKEENTKELNVKQPKVAEESFVLKLSKPKRRASLCYEDSFNISGLTELDFLETDDENDSSYEEITVNDDDESLPSFTSAGSRSTMKKWSSSSTVSSKSKSPRKNGRKKKKVVDLETKFNLSLIDEEKSQSHLNCSASLHYSTNFRFDCGSPDGNASAKFSGPLIQQINTTDDKSNASSLMEGRKLACQNLSTTPESELESPGPGETNSNCPDEVPKESSIASSIVEEDKLVSVLESSGAEETNSGGLNEMPKGPMKAPLAIQQRPPVRIRSRCTVSYRPPLATFKELLHRSR